MKNTILTLIIALAMPTVHALSNADKAEARTTLETFLKLESAHKWDKSFPYLSEVGQEIEFLRAKNLNDRMREFKMLGFPGIKVFSENNLSKKDFVTKVTDATFEFSKKTGKHGTTEVLGFVCNDTLCAAKALTLGAVNDDGTQYMDISTYYVYQENGAWKVSMDSEQVQRFMSYSDKKFGKLQANMLEAKELLETVYNTTQDEL